MAASKCMGDCLKCSFQQQTYCAAQRSYAIMSYMPAIIERLDRIEAEIPKFKPEGVFNPMTEAEAQDGSGAENREPKQ